MVIMDLQLELLVQILALYNCSYHRLVLSGVPLCKFRKCSCRWCDARFLPRIRQVYDELFLAHNCICCWLFSGYSFCINCVLFMMIQCSMAMFLFHDSSILWRLVDSLPLWVLISNTPNYYREDFAR